MFGKSHAIPEVNPEDGSYMPKCSPGPCAEYSYSYDSKGNQTSTCIRYLEPTAIPHATNFFNSKPDTPRTSCGYAEPMSIFNTAEPTYYVYWEDKPKGGKRTKRTKRKGRKTYRKN
jgi:hypothetical protein